MRVVLAEDYGFCFGVERAVERLIEVLKDSRVVTDGDIVHNEGVMDMLKSVGLMVKKDPAGTEADVFAIRAHGTSPKRLDEVKRRFKRVVDLTCPIVESLFETAKELKDRGYTVVVFGKEGHAEMEALKGHVEDAVVTRKVFKVDGSVQKVAVVSQTTSPWKEFSSFVGDMVEENFHVKDWKVINTVCYVTVRREMEVERLSRMCDVVVVVGGKHSANTGKLYEIAKNLTRAIWISSPDELGSYDFDGVDCVGIVSGTSTPKEDVEKVRDEILRRGKDGEKER